MSLFHCGIARDAGSESDNVKNSNFLTFHIVFFLSVPISWFSSGFFFWKATAELIENINIQALLIRFFAFILYEYFFFPSVLYFYGCIQCPAGIFVQIVVPG